MPTCAGGRRRRGHAGRQAGGHGRLLGLALGLIDLLLERDGGTWRVVTHSVSEARPIYSGEDRPSPAGRGQPEYVLDAVARDHEATLAYVRRAVGKTSAPLHSYFALVADDPSVQIVSIAQRWYIERDDGRHEHEGLPVLSAAAPFKAGGRGGPDYYTDVPAGDVAIKNVADLYLYPNTIRAVRITGATADWLERSAGHVQPLSRPARRTLLLNPDFPSYNFDVIDGVTYRDRPEPAVALRRRRRAGEPRMPTGSSTSRSTARRSTDGRSSSSPPTTTARRAAAISRARRATRSSSRPRTPTAT